LPIVVVGGGPVGLTAALELLHHGLRPIVIEAKPELAWSSRAICISRRSLEIYDRLGLGATFLRRGLGWHRGQSFYRRHKVFDLEMPYGPDDKHPPFINLQQFHTEKILVDAFTARGGDLRWKTEVTGATVAYDRVTLKIEHEGATDTIDAAYVVAADGARSTMRDLLGLKLAGTSYEGRYLIADIEIHVERPVERRVWFDPPSNPGSTVIIHIQPDNIWRIDYQLRDDEDPDEAQREENVRARIQSHLEMIGEPAQWRLHWRSLYRAHCLTLDSYRHGRVVFAGDAAHLVPIFGVRGLNSGIEDAHNLGWKLAVAQEPAFLNSYSEERRAATLENITQATKSTWFMSPPTPGFQWMRDATLMLAVDHAFVRPLINPRQSAPFAYPASPLSTCYPHQGLGVDVGAPLPNLKTAPGRYLHDDLNPRGFTLLLSRQHVSAGEFADLQRWVATIAGRLVVAELPDAAMARLAAAALPAYVVRPDEHIAARFSRLDVPAIASALERSFGGQRCSA
jgi:3-(3-hydroxy-phenyl)propionate hydroxylase